MKWLNLKDIKAQCRIEQDFHEEDELLEMYGESAEETILDWCNRSYEDFIQTYGKIPMPIVHATMLLVDLSYKERNPVSMQNLSVVPYGNIDILVKPYMIL